MNILDLQKDIVSKNLKNIYIFYGPENALIELYIKRIRSIFNSFISCDNCQALIGNLSGNSLFKTDKELYVIRGDKDFQTSEVYWDLMNKASKKEIFAIFKYVSVDQRSKFFKKFSDFCVEFDYMSPDILKKHIKKDIAISDSDCDYLIKICKKDYGRILNEVDKVQNAAKAYKLSDSDAFKMCYNSGVFYEEPEDVAYDLVSSILSRNIKSIYSLLNESERRGDNPIMILSLIHSNIKAVLQVQTLADNKNISDATGLTPFQVKNAKKYVGRYTDKELCRFIQYINYVDKSIKNGVISSDMSLDYLLLNVL